MSAATRVSVSLTLAPTPMTRAPRVEVTVDCDERVRKETIAYATDMAERLIVALRGGSAGNRAQTGRTPGENVSADGPEAAS